jgi:hypothetical protein
MPPRFQDRQLAHALLCAVWALAAAGCNADADVVAAPLTADGGSNSAADGGKDASASDSACDLSERFERARLPPVALDLILDCEVRFSPLPTGDPGSGITPEEFSKLVTAPQLQADGDLLGAALCADMTIGWYALPLNKPERAILCPQTCDSFRRQISALLARDGCDGPFDLGEGFGGLPAGSGFPGGGAPSHDDDAGSSH